MLKLVSVVGARPQFIKAAPVSRHIRKKHREILVHTGQHYDLNMSDIFFSELNIPVPDYNLGAGSGNHGRQTGEMLARIEEVLVCQKPDWVLVYGDTNSTLAGALAAVKLQIPVAHVEAGLRSYNRKIPEEINRLLTDHLSSILFCPSDGAVRNLAREGIASGVYKVGDVMYDAILECTELADRKSSVMERLNLREKAYLLVTVHRPSNTDACENLQKIFDTLCSLDFPVVFPLHPRTKRRMKEFGLEEELAKAKNILAIEPVGYFDMLILEKNALKILTDSGGVQKEAYLLGTPCITMREETEWLETVEAGWNVLVGTDAAQIRHAVWSPPPLGERPSFYGTGQAGRLIAEILSNQK